MLLVFICSQFLVRLICLFIRFFLGRVKYSGHILYLENFPEENSGYQYRAAKWAKLLSEDGGSVSVFTTNQHPSLYDFNLQHHSLYLSKCLWIRFFQCIAARKFETVIVRRELLLYNDYGNLFMERFLLSIHPNVILDFDDDIAAAKNQPKPITSWFGKLMAENGNKFNDSLRLYKKFIVASDYLRNKIKHENPSIVDEKICVIPTCVDYNIYPPKMYDSAKKCLSLGWIGGNQNYFLIEGLLPVLEELSQTFDFNLIIIGGKPFTQKTSFETIFYPWSLATEVDNIRKIDIGLMPLHETTVGKGKGGFKLIQYMGLGVVSVASAVTINTQIIDDKKNSFLVHNPSDWKEVLAYLLSNTNILPKIGTKARDKIHQQFTFQANFRKYKTFVFGH
jgi:glycosyltransferase involved in cell wall biosynthesis